MEKTKLHTKAGYEIAVNLYEPESQVSHVVLILPANGTKQVFYSDFARLLSGNKFMNIPAAFIVYET